MELKEFVNYILTEVTEGIVSAQKSLSGSGAIVMPPRIETGIPAMTMYDASTGKRPYVDLVEFKVAIGEISKNEKGATIGVIFGNAGAKVGANKGIENNALTEVKFSIPILYPIYPENKEMGT